MSRMSGRILFISVNRESVNMAAWPLGMASVAAAAARAGFETNIVDLMTCRDPNAAIDEAIADFAPGLVALSIRNIDDQRMVGTVFYLDEVRERVAHIRTRCTVPIVLGGAGYSIFPGPALDYLGADYGLPGEGEAAFPALAARLLTGADPAGPYELHRRGAPPAGARILIRELDEHPLPAVPAGAAEAYGDDLWVPVQTRRGCPMDCSYCSTPAIEGRELRRRSPTAVVRWLAGCAGRGFSRFYFVDNTFTMPGDYAADLCRAIIGEKLQITWRAIVYPGALTPWLAELMARAGCAEVSLGSESGAEEVLRAMNKRFTPARVRETAAALGAQGIRRMGFLMLGGPCETLATARESLSFAETLGLESVKITVGIRIYPGTPLERRARDEGIITRNDDLLLPRFYLTPGIGGELWKLADRWLKEKKNWVG